jgi:phage-related baseplate assembly protein
MNELNNTPDISFIGNETASEIVERIKNNYESEMTRLEGKSVHISSDSVKAEINAFALEFAQIYQLLDRAGKQGLLKYSYGEFLDNLAAAKNTKRNPAQAATVTVRFSLEEARASAVGIPAGTRVSNDGEVYFETKEYCEIAAGSLFTDIKMTCTESGDIGNNIQVGEINILVDPVNYIDHVSNTEVSSGGSDIEDDESLRERTFLAPSAYSVAGPADAYAYMVKSFNNGISDVKVTTDTATAIVHIIVLMDDGAIPAEGMLTEISNFINQPHIRPLTDQVVVEAPTAVSYDIELTYYINKSDTTKAMAIQTAANEAINKYIEWQSGKIGRDITPDKLTQLLMDAGVKRVAITEPQYQALEDDEVASLSANVAITYGGIADD